mmetsp:Transcript_31521/g.54629  ORF Transcript_31521/g.54629 Transcript_31521/m.54629 type:complete len:124 (+) Transcript_31521:274-645(+)
MAPKSEIYRTGRWSDEEHSIYLDAKKRFGRDWRKISEAIRTRVPSQVKSHDQKYRITERRRRAAHEPHKLDAAVQVNLDYADCKADSNEDYSTSSSEASPVTTAALPSENYIEGLDNLLYFDL